RKMPMMVGIVFGLTFQALALSRLGRHDDAVAATDEAVRVLDGARPEGAENIFRWRAEVLAAAGRSGDADAATARARVEIDAKAQKLRDPALRESYLRSRSRAV